MGTGGIQLGDKRQMMCLLSGVHIKLVPLNHNLDKQIDKQMALRLDKKGNIDSCSIVDGPCHEKQTPFVERGKAFDLQRPIQQEKLE